MQCVVDPEMVCDVDAAEDAADECVPANKMFGFGVIVTGKNFIRRGDRMRG
jgi:hypothetical protein